MGRRIVRGHQYLRMGGVDVFSLLHARVKKRGGGAIVRCTRWKEVQNDDVIPVGRWRRRWEEGEEDVIGLINAGVEMRGGKRGTFVGGDVGEFVVGLLDSMLNEVRYCIVEFGKPT